MPASAGYCQGARRRGVGREDELGAAGGCTGEAVGAFHADIRSVALIVICDRVRVPRRTGMPCKQTAPASEGEIKPMVRQQRPTQKPPLPGTHPLLRRRRCWDG